MTKRKLIRVIICPFCKHQNYTLFHLNVLCSCGAKYYIHSGVFMNRNTGDIVRNLPFELKEVTE